MEKPAYRVDHVGTLWQVRGPKGEYRTCFAFRYKAEELAAELNAEKKAEPLRLATEDPILRG